MVTATAPHLSSALDDRARRASTVRLHCIWALVVFSSLPWSGIASVYRIPSRAEQSGTAVALLLALGIAIYENWQVRIGASPFVALGLILAVAAIVPPVYGSAGLDALARALRLGLTVLVAGLIAPPLLQGDGAMPVRLHLRMYGMLTAAILVGAVVIPSLAFEPTLGRLQGLVPPVQPPAAGEIGAVTAGLAALAAAAGTIRAHVAVWLVAMGSATLVLSHTRTAAVALLVALIFGAAANATASGRARRALALLLFVGAMSVLLAPGPLGSWFTRGQNEEQLTSLSGRRSAWDVVLSERRTGATRWFGVGLGDKRIGGLPIDSSWLATYREQGVVGVFLMGTLVLTLAWCALRSPPTPGRAAATFLIVFALVSSITETGISDVSPYFLHLAVAGFLLQVPRRDAIASRTG
jgi:hypothetical protein